MVPGDRDGRRGTALVGGCDEASLLRALLPHLPAGPAALLGPGDDTAVLAAPDARVVATTDLLVEGRDFRRDWSSARDVGWKAAVQNLADVAAMGAVPTGLLVALGLPPELELAWVEDLARGLGEACAAHGTGVVGGDLSAAPAVVVAITALGDLAGRAPVRRDGARPGDVLALAGPLGASAAGLDALLAGLGSAPGEDEGQDPAVAAVLAAHRRPAPPLTAGPAAAVAGATAMLDVSDGLGRDLARLAAASGVHADVDAAWETARVAGLAPAARAVLAARAAAATASPGSTGPAAEGGLGSPADALARSWVRGGGEDHALLAAFPPGAALPAPFVALGRVLAERPGAPAVTVGGDEPLTGGWDHFAPS